MVKKVKQRWHFREIFILLYLGNHYFVKPETWGSTYVQCNKMFLSWCDSCFCYEISYGYIIWKRMYFIYISCIFIFYLWWRVCLCPIDWSVSDNHVDEPISMQLSQFHHLPCIRLIVVVTVWTAIPIYVLKTIFTVTTYFVATWTSSISTISY